MPSNMLAPNINKDFNIEIETLTENSILIRQQNTARSDLAMNMVAGALLGLITTALVSWNDHNWRSQTQKELTFASSQTLASEILGGLVGATAGVIYNYTKQLFCADNNDDDVEQFYPLDTPNNITLETPIQI